MNINDQATATFWVQIEPVWSRWYPDSLQGVKVRHVSQRKPRQPVPGCVLARLHVTVPAAAFIPRVLEGDVTLEPGQFETVPATVEAEPLGDQP
jgi:hypothetical protein